MTGYVEETNFLDVSDHFGPAIVVGLDAIKCVPVERLQEEGYGVLLNSFL